MVERFLGKKEVGSSILPSGSCLKESKGKGVGETGVSLCRKVLKTERLSGSECPLVGGTSDVRFSPPAQNWYNETMAFKKNWLKFAIGLAGVFLVRLIPFRAPNVEPVLAVAMPFAKQYKYVGAFFFGFLSILIFDIVTNEVGIWTPITAVAYGIVAAGAYPFLRKRTPTAGNFAAYGVIGTLVYDALTGLTIGPIFNGQSFMGALMGQIPFTLAHLAGTIVFSFAFSPLLYRWVVMNKQLEADTVFSKLFGTSRV